MNMVSPIFIFVTYDTLIINPLCQKITMRNNTINLQTKELSRLSLWDRIRFYIRYQIINLSTSTEVKRN